MSFSKTLKISYSQSRKKAYKQYLEANKRAKGGDRKSQNFNENQLCQVGTIENTGDEAAEKFGVSRRNIHRYARLAELCEGLLAMVDAVKLNEKSITGLLPEAMREAESERKVRYIRAALAKYEEYLKAHPEESESWT